MDKKFELKNATSFLCWLSCMNITFCNQTFVYTCQTREIIEVGNNTKSENAQCYYIVNYNSCTFI